MKRIFGFSFFVYVIFVIAFALRAEVKEAKIKVYLDAGHGGIDGGTAFGTLIEKDFNLKVTLRLKEVLEEKGFVVYLTRDGDYDLSSDPHARKRTDLTKRANLINQSNADFFISIHMNSFSDPVYRGAQTFYYAKGHTQNELIAASIQNSFIELLQNTKRKHKKIDHVFLLEHVEKPGCLIECGFLSNAEEAKLLQDEEYITRLCRAIYYGIDNFSSQL